MQKSIEQENLNEPRDPRRVRNHEQVAFMKKLETGDCYTVVTIHEATGDGTEGMSYGHSGMSEKVTSTESAE